MKKVKSSFISAMVIMVISTIIFSPGNTGARMRSPPPQKMNIIIIGDRVVDIAYNLGVLPKAMSVRGSLWPMAKKLKAASQILGCPRCIVLKKETVPLACKEYGVRRLIVEKSDPFCIYMPNVKPENVVPIMAEEDVVIEYVDFSNGLEDAVCRTAELLNRESKTAEVINRYKKELAAAKEKLSAKKRGERAIIFNGIYQSSTGKTMVRVEAPGGYSDRFLLEPLGYINVGDCFKPDNGNANKGYYLVIKKKNGIVLHPVIKANPDVIIITGDVFAVQKAIYEYEAVDPDLAQINAIRNMAIFTLPAYVDSSVLEYPQILKKWAIALAE